MRTCTLCQLSKPYIYLHEKTWTRPNGKPQVRKFYGDGVMKTPWHGSVCPSCKKYQMKGIKRRTEPRPKLPKKGICRRCSAATRNYFYCPPCHSIVSTAYGDEDYGLCPGITITA